MLNPVDIRPDHLRIVRNVLREYLPPNVNVWVFGSRANWTATDSSDLDLALEGGSRLGRKTMGALEDAFENSSLPYTVDVMDLNRISDSFRRIVEAQRVPFPAAQDSGGAKADWRRVALKEVIDLKMSSVDKKTKGNERAVRLCNYTDVYNNSFIYADMDFMMATATEQEISKCSLLVGDVIITKDSEKYDDIGVPALVREDIPNLVCGYHLAILRPSPLEIDGTYLFYALNTNEVQQQFQSYANGITRFGLRKADIGLAEILIPPLPQQRTIAHILGTLDDKIELNRRMNVTLEEMARALFKSWFVNFDPVRAKMDGRWRPGESLPGLPANLYGLFPDRLVDAELGEIPERWKIKAVGEIATIAGGTTPSTKHHQYWEDGTHYWATPKDLSALSTSVLLYTKRKITNAGLEQIGSGLLPKGTVLLSSRAPIGYLAITEIPVAVNQGFIAMLPHKSVSNLFLLYWCEASHNEIVNYANGSVFPEISKGNFRQILLVMPSITTMGAFHRIVRHLHERIVSNERQSHSLSALRDTLLPKLIAGKMGTNKTKQISKGKI